MYLTWRDCAHRLLLGIILQECKVELMMLVLVEEIDLVLQALAGDL